MNWLISALFFIFLLSVQCLKYSSFKEGILPPKESCGLQIEGKQRGAAVGEFPWLVYIPLESRRRSSDSNQRCTGVLINKRYVVTSVHCFALYIDRVRVGQYDSRENTICGRSGCEPVLEIAVEYTFGHPEISMGFLRLAQDVPFTDFIQPICLPFEDVSRPEIGDTVYTSGWGQTHEEGDYAFIQKKIEQVLINNEECSRNNTDPEFVCLSYDKEASEIPCDGDRGSPIMHRTGNGQMVLEGILPAADTCSEGEVLPGMRVSEQVMEWLRLQMRP